MSKITNSFFECSKCKKAFEFEKYDSINESFSKDLVEKLVKGELNNIKCPFCGEIHFVLYPVLYHKMGLIDTMIQFTNEEKVEDVLKQLKAMSLFASVFQNPFGNYTTDIIEVYDDWDKFIERIKNI